MTAPISQYLQALKDPESLRDEDAIKDKQAKLQEVEDPIARLHLRSEIHTLEQADITPLEDAFVVYAKGWAEEAGVTVDAFLAEGVPRSVLKRAGLIKGGRKSRRSSGGRSRVSRETILQSIQSLGSDGEEFTVSDVAEASGATTAGVRLAVKDLLEEGRVEKTGTREPETTRRGTRPATYALTES